MSVRDSDYPEYYENIRKQIIDICKKINEDTDDSSLDKYLQLLCRLKYKLFNEKNEHVVTARKHNGFIKFQIRELEQKMKDTIENLEKPILDDKGEKL